MTTTEIKELLKSSSLDYGKIENEALNAYLPKIFPTCPFTEEVCRGKQCQKCGNFKKTFKNKIVNLII